jgi:hypothetical protein
MLSRNLKFHHPPCPNPWIALALAGFLSCSFLLPARAQDGYRTWMDKQGREITAKLISQNAGSVTLRSDEGKTRRIPKEKFSASDRQYLEGLMDNESGDEEPAKEQAAASEPEPESPAESTGPTADANPDRDWEEEVEDIAQEVGGDIQPPSAPEPVQTASDKPEPDSARTASTEGAPKEPQEDTGDATEEDDARPSENDYAALTGAGAAEATMDVEPAPQTTTTTESEPTTEVEPIEEIPYKTVNEWDLPNKEGGGRRIVISPNHANAESLRNLGRQLMLETEDEVYTDIEVFTSAEAAELAEENVSELNLEDRGAFERHYVAHYHKNVAQSMIQYELFPARAGAQQIVNLN